MENPSMSDGAHSSELRSYIPRNSDLTEIHALRIPVGTNLADVERWLIFATLKKCSGNKTRAAALLGVSLKTLYNRLNAYRAQRVALDERMPIDTGFEINCLHGDLSVESV
jgi:DNA-binding NtrC family response regulator